MYLNRHIESVLESVSKVFKVVLIVGARQVGKSTLLRKLFSEISSITFDPIEDVRSARRDPQLFLRDHKTPLILDEVQYVPELLAAIKRYVDDVETKPQFFLTGSQNLMVLKEVADSMAGRVCILPVVSDDTL